MIIHKKTALERKQEQILCK